MNEFSTWINRKFLEWQSGTGRNQHQNAFARYLGVEESTLSRWMNGGKPPDTWRSVQILIRRYGDEAREALGIDTEFIFIDHLPPRLERLLRQAVDEVNFELTRRGLDADTDEAERITIAIFEKYGFNKRIILQPSEEN